MASSLLVCDRKCILDSGSSDRMDIQEPFPLVDFPIELIWQIFFFVDCPKSLGRLMRVSKRFFEYLNNDLSLWRNVCLKMWRNLGFHEKVSLEKVIQTLDSFCANYGEKHKSWIWVASCLAHDDREYGKSMRCFSTSSGRSLVSIGRMMRRKLCSIGVEIYLDGSIFYVGRFSDGKLHGKGSIIWNGGGKYEGDWVNGRREGWGSYTWLNGDRYVGEFKNDGKKEGRGTFYYADGDVFEGFYRNDEREGFGRMTWKATQFTYEGTFVGNEPQDPELSLHPALRNAITQQVCTGTVTGKGTSFGQFIYECECADFCVVCWNHCPHTSHSTFRSIGIRRWSDGTHCSCVDKDCCARRQLVSGPPSKKLKAH